MKSVRFILLDGSCPSGRLGRNPKNPHIYTRRLRYLRAMLYVMKRIHVFAFVLAFGVVSCDSSTDSGLPDQTAADHASAPAGSVKIGEVRIPDEYFQLLERDVDAYMDANSSGDYAKYVEYVHPGSFEHDSLKANLIKELEMYREAGIQQTIRGYDVQFVSEFVDDGKHDIALLVLNVRHEIVLTGMYAENPQGLESMIRDKYGRDNYTFNPDVPSYDIEGEVKMYCFVPKGEKRFYFLQDTFVQSPKLAHLMEYPIMKRMKELEAEYASSL